MSVEQTLSIIKPDGVQKNLIGEIYGRFEKASLEIVAARMIHLSQEQAEGFYAVHAASAIPTSRASADAARVSASEPFSKTPK